VAHTQESHHQKEKPLIRCAKCGEVCKGEVLRVQAKHFHIKCFTCKGESENQCHLCICYIQDIQFMHTYDTYAIWAKCA